MLQRYFTVWDGEEAWHPEGTRLPPPPNHPRFVKRLDSSKLFRRHLAWIHLMIILGDYAALCPRRLSVTLCEEPPMPNLPHLVFICAVGALLASCAQLSADVTPAVAQRAQELCTAALKASKIQDCLATPFNVQSAQLPLTDA